jgi:hypothetical protein
MSEANSGHTGEVRTFVAVTLRRLQTAQSAKI